MPDEWERDARRGIRKRAVLGPVLSLDPAFEPYRDTIVEEIQRPEIKEEEGVEVEKKDKISELEVNRENVNITVELVSFEEIKNVGVSKYDGKPLILCIAKVKDDTGNIPLTLWNRDIEKITDGSIGPGSILHIKNGYVREFRGEKRLTLGREGQLFVIMSLS